MDTSIGDKAARFISRLGATGKSIAKVLLAGGGAKIASRQPAGALVIMGNGPSLKHNISNDAEILRHIDTLAVNFAANAPEFTTLRPEYYVLADPHFFNAGSDPNVDRLIGNLAATGWPMTLFVPKNTRLPDTLLHARHLTVERFSFTGFEGFECMENLAFSKGWGMPRPRNVLIPSIMIGIWLGYRDIYIVGADHTWTQTLSVDEENRVVSIQPHFYKEDEQELKRVHTTYHSVKMHQILESFSIAFRSYHTLQRYAARHGVSIYNATPGSFIDAFQRRTLPRRSNTTAIDNG